MNPHVIKASRLGQGTMEVCSILKLIAWHNIVGLSHASGPDQLTRWTPWDRVCDQSLFEDPLARMNYRDDYSPISMDKGSSIWAPITSPTGEGGGIRRRKRRQMAPLPSPNTGNNLSSICRRPP